MTTIHTISLYVKENKVSITQDICPVCSRVDIKAIWNPNMYFKL